MHDFTAVDVGFMSRALELGRRGLYTSEPNPRVGCVLVHEGRVVGEGFHRFAGQGHAEVNALAEAGEYARGATAYVTLEPCSHQGKTPPCADALIRAGVTRVISAMEDPNPRVSGRGHERLRQSGISVASGLLEHQARALNPGFIKRMSQGLPWVRIKQAMSLDGRTAMASGESQWITGAAARSDVQKLRARSSAIITGIETVLADDPAMTLREQQLGLENAAEVILHQPLRIILDSQLRIPLNAQILSGPGETLVVSAVADSIKVSALEARGVKVLWLPGLGGHPDLRGLLSWLAAEKECNEVLVEAGATLSGAFVQTGLVDELVIYMAPKLLGERARALFNLPGLDRMADQISVEIEELRALGSDWRISARLVKPSVVKPDLEG
jgi:diaminohydroxyphosphoribosylaminopyrimidine deaminase/5-amino-6-(5-phosphoribosylamino)uracil reductase